MSKLIFESVACVTSTFRLHRKQTAKQPKAFFIYADRIYANATVARSININKCDNLYISVWAKRRRFDIAKRCPCVTVRAWVVATEDRNKKWIKKKLTWIHMANFMLIPKNKNKRIKNCRRKIFHLRWTINLEWRSLIHRGDLIRFFFLSLSLSFSWVWCWASHTPPQKRQHKQQPNKTYFVHSNRFYYFVFFLFFSSLLCASFSGFSIMEFHLLLRIVSLPWCGLSCLCSIAGPVSPPVPGAFVKIKNIYTST